MPYVGCADRILVTDAYGRQKIQRQKTRQSSGYVKIFYGSRALEWLNLRKIFQDLLIFFGFSHLCPVVADVVFAWRYADNLTSVFYKPAAVFKTFAFIDLLDEDASCACSIAQRLKPFCDPLTLNESSSFVKTNVHVRTTDLSIIQHHGLRNALTQGLNHIPLRPTKISETIAIVMDAFSQLADILDLHRLQFPMQLAVDRLHTICLSSLKAASTSNKFGFRETSKSLLEIPAVQNELGWLHKHLYCSGLDKAANNACFVCIRHIRLQALERLSGPDFTPCMGKSTWKLPTQVLDEVTEELRSILPESLPQYNALPYLMATYKHHKAKYRWLTNAFHTVFSNIALLLTITSNEVLESFKIWAHSTERSYKNFLNVKTSMFWLVDSIIDTTLNLPEKITDVFVADITQCYESIPLEGDNNLLDAIAFIVNTAYKQAATNHPKADTLLWIRIGQDGSPANAKWGTRAPNYGNWFPLTSHRLLRLHSWLMSNCHVTLGDRVWVQKSGIPMGFSCSPIWCNMYLLAYEAKFIIRLAKLGKTDLMIRFQSAFRYIDDLFLINVGNPRDFLSPQELCSYNNPYWIYPLTVLQIKEETSKYDSEHPTRGIEANFMNMTISVNTVYPEMYQCRKYDKRRNLPFKYTQYIKFRSNRSVRQAYNIVISQTMPILYISNTVEAAVDEIHCLIQTMTNNGFNTKRLINNISQFLRCGSFPGVKIDTASILLKLDSLVTLPQT